MPREERGNNADAHPLALPATVLGAVLRRASVKRQVMRREVVVAVTNGKLDFGPWEQILCGEFDGPRPPSKRVSVKIVGE